MEKNKTVQATLAALFAQIIFGFSFMFTKICLETASPFVVIADRYLIAFLALSIIMLFSKTKFRWKKGMGTLFLMTFFQPVCYFILETYGIRLTGSSFSAVMIAMIPVISMIGGIFFLGEIPSLLQYIFTGLSVGGVVVVTLSQSVDGVVTLPGFLCLLGAVLASVAYNITSRSISKKFTPMERTYAMTGIGLIVFLGIALVENQAEPMKIFCSFTSVSYTAGILYLGVVSSVLAFFFLNYANTYLPVSKTTVFSNLTTVVSVVAGVFVLGERFSLIAWLATVLIIIGVLGAQLQKVGKTSI